MMMFNSIKLCCGNSFAINDFLLPSCLCLCFSVAAEVIKVFLSDFRSSLLQGLWNSCCCLGQWAYSSCTKPKSSKSTFENVSHSKANDLNHTFKNLRYKL